MADPLPLGSGGFAPRSPAQNDEGRARGPALAPSNCGLGDYQLVELTELPHPPVLAAVHERVTVDPALV
jgi:hypothetical protein